MIPSVEMINVISCGKKSVKQICCAMAAYLKPGVDVKTIAHGYLAVDIGQIHSSFIQLKKAELIYTERTIKHEEHDCKKVQAYPTKELSYILSFYHNKEEIKKALVFMICCYRVGLRSTHQVKVLSVILNKETINQKDLISEVEIHQSSTSAISRCLEKLGLITIEREPNNGVSTRRTFYHISERGKSVLTPKPKANA